MRGRLTPGLALLRATGFSALLLLLWNPITTLRRAGGRVDQPLVLLDASLSMAGRGGRWREALDSARALARGGVIWRFGTQVAAFDSAPPADGASRLAPALTAAAARGGPIAVVTDGELEDVAGLAPDCGDRYDAAQSELRCCWETGNGKREACGHDCGHERRTAPGFARSAAPR